MIPDVACLAHVPMISLAPQLHCEASCVHDRTALTVDGWHIPGMRCLAKLNCPRCGRHYFGDLPIGQALATPRILDVETGRVHDPDQPDSPLDWFGDWLQSGFAQRTSERLDWTTETFQTVRRPILLNCLDACYGHSLLTLLNAQDYIDNFSDRSLIVLVPEQLRWLVPRGVAQVWTVPWVVCEGAHLVRESGNRNPRSSWGLRVLCREHCESPPPSRQVGHRTVQRSPPLLSAVWVQDGGTSCHHIYLAR